VLLDSIHKYNADNGSFITEYAKHFKMDASGNVNATGGKVLNINDYTSSKLNVHFEVMAERSIPDELENETGENLWIVVISYAAMFAYIGVAIGQFPSRISSGFTLAVIGIMIVLASVLASMGLISYLGIGFTMISAEVIPFLILAIGVDNMFIIKNAIERQKYENLEDRVAHGLREVGPSITTAAICEALAFLVGSLTKMPALQAFCLQAATAILFNYIFQITIFVVAFIFDEERKAKNQMDVLCCVTR
jgi:Niemann-Pick C1 protein